MDPISTDTDIATQHTCKAGAAQVDITPPPGTLIGVDFFNTVAHGFAIDKEPIAIFILASIADIKALPKSKKVDIVCVCLRLIK